MVTENCDDGSIAQTLVTVIGGHEEESESGVTTLDSNFLTLLIRSFDCAGHFFSDRRSGPAGFTFSPSLQTAAVTGTIAVATGNVVVDGETVIDGTTTNAEIETLEDRNITTGA